MFLAKEPQQSYNNSFMKQMCWFRIKFDYKSP